MSDETTPQDGKAMSPASAGSRAVAWAVLLAEGERIYDVYGVEEEAKAIDEAVTGNYGIVPLYRSPTLTDEERDAIIVAAEQSEKAARLARTIPGPTASVILQHASVLRGIAKRLS